MTATQKTEANETSFPFWFSTHTQVMVIALIVLTVMFFLSYYYSVTEDRSHQLDRYLSKESYISRLLSLYHMRAQQLGSPKPLRAGLDSIAEDDDVARVRVVSPVLDMQLMAQGYRPDLVLSRTLPLYNEKAQPAGNIHIDFWKTPQSEASSRLTLINLVIVVDILVLFGLALHLLLREIVTRPLEKFVDATKRIAQGDFDSYLDQHVASREQQRLATSFNFMLDHLQDYRDRLQRINEDLEERVTHRTEQLQEEKGRSEGILASVADGVYTVNEDWEITTFNPAAEKIKGVKAEDVIGKKCHQVLNYPFCETDCLLKRLPREDESPEREVFVEEFEREGDSFIVSGAPLRDATGQQAGGVESLKDISYVKKLHDQIRQADKLSSIGILAAGVAHEINNPLSNIKLYAQILSEGGIENDSTVASSLENIFNETNRATRIVRNLLEFSRQGMPELQRTEIHTVVDDAVEIMRPQIKLDQTEVLVQLPDNLPAIWADRGNMQQVFVNLLTNAKHALHDKGGTIRIRAWHDTVNKKVILTFADSGSGIPAENLDRIFDPFFTTKEVGEGTGLGLAISYGIIKDHGGDIRVKSRVGEGTEFTISLPPAI